MGRDANDILQEGGPDAIAKMLAKARTYKAKGKPNGKAGPHATKRAMPNGAHEKAAAKVVAKVQEPRPPRLEFPSEIRVSTKVDDIVKGLVPRRSTGALYGPSGVGKSFTAIDLGFHVALGMDWHGRRVRAAAPVLYVGLEGVEGLRKRIDAARRKLGDPGKMFARLTVQTPLNKSKAGAAGQKEIIEAAKELEAANGMPVGLIVIDTVAWAMHGDDENSTQDMNSFVGRMREISHATSAAVTAVHHPGKDETRGMRGSYVLYNGVDVVMKVEAIGETPQKRLFAEKVRDGSGGEVFTFTLPIVELGTDDDGDPITTRVLEACEPPAITAIKAKVRKLAAGDRVAFEILRKSIIEAPAYPPPSPDLPTQGGTAFTTVEAFRARYTRETMKPDLKPDTQRKALNRATTNLQAAGLLRVYEEWIWIPQ
jgi:hypothetical protein